MRKCPTRQSTLNASNIAKKILLLCIMYLDSVPVVTVESDIYARMNFSDFVELWNIFNIAKINPSPKCPIYWYIISALNV